MKRDKAEIISRMTAIGIIPVVRAVSTDMARRAVAAILKGGISVLEITMTVPGAVRMIEALRSEIDPEAIIGAGTVLDARTAQECVDAGAQFIVSPALDLATIALCGQQGIVVMPGALTPTEVVTAWAAGADFVKVFPAGAVGGASYIKALKAPLPQVKIVPTGGVSLQNAAAFIKAGAEALGVGNDLVDVQALREERDELITERARLFVEIVQQARAK
ncbi:MAG TPA: bifunctional 4-hydroxy-2-oxoglutarate aldolase/2-dehydro-3-deoxy-phosphogluconate aldolase [Polyangia bacterium]|jgi:2-dehydro-3-deoxyphosphogluconate aldolase/(4S)-4-hydroxy-2-oxoglutarate aldolase|nr:bifunctional 4-hydroxy-2-oxoglutarate aldolase/2-dehydro-3-deoxy-phosphogluconate aldolase [Polyangia bacterium]